MAARMEKRKPSELGQGETGPTRALLDIADPISLLSYLIREEDGGPLGDSSPAAY